MNTIEERIRAATRAAADTVPPDSVPPLRLPAERPAWFRWRPAATARAGWLAPAAAAAAMVVIAVLIVTVSHSPREGAAASAPASATPGPPVPGPPASSYVASGQVPRYYLAITSHGNPNFNPSFVDVRATATGQTIATYTPAYGLTVVAVTAAADDRTFVLDEQPWAGRSGNQSFEPRSFFLARLNPAGLPAAVQRLNVSVPRGQLVTGLALSPDGRRLAMAVQPDNVKAKPDLEEVRVYTLATGAVRAWAASGIIGTGPDDARSMSWTADGRTLAFEWTGPTSGTIVVRLLDVGAPVGGLLARSRLATPLTGKNPAGPGCQEDSVITPDGSAVVCGAIEATSETVNPNATGSPLKRGAQTAFFEFSTVTGKVTRTLGRWTFPRVGALAVDVLWTSPSGSVLIGVIPTAGDGRVGIIRGNEFTPLSTPAAGVSVDSGIW